MLKVDFQKQVARVMLDRPDVHNAFNDELIPQVTQTFSELGARDDIRVIVLGGNGKSFCAGADLNWMKRMVAGRESGGCPRIGAHVPLHRQVS